MAKSSKPLAIAVHPDLYGNEDAWQGLADKGHGIVECPLLKEFDIVFGPNCFRMTPTLLKYLPLAIKGVRAIKYPVKKKEVAQ